jgi:NAD(P)H dehydrogenase (quinone)
MSKIVIAYHSGYGHTAKVAEHVAKGARDAGAEVSLVKVDTIDETGWALLDGADAIIFGSPTYMGSVSAPFKTFQDATAQRWYQQVWRGKLAAGFSVSGSLSGDKLASLLAMVIFSQQHGMIWTGTGVMQNEQAKGDEMLSKDALNRIGSYVGLMAQANNDAPENTITAGDLKTAELFGANVAAVAKRLGPAPKA